MQKRTFRGIKYEEKYKSGRIWPYFISAKIENNIEEEKAIEWIKEVFHNLESCSIYKKKKLKNHMS
jgi:hypothetical protein